MSDVLTELLNSRIIPAAARPFVLALCMGEGGTNEYAWWRCYGDPANGPMSYTGPLTTVFDTAHKLWPGKDNSHALGPGQFQPATYEEVAKRTGLPTLEPQSQLANIWNHVEFVYKEKTGGSAEADIAAGRQLEVAQALAKTWTSLGNATEFMKHYGEAVTAVAGNPAPQPVVQSPVITDPELLAMASLISVLRGLDAAACKRVFTYVTARFGA